MCSSKAKTPASGGLRIPLGRPRATRYAWYMATIAVEYIYDANKLDLLAQVRPKHREHLRSLFDEGKLLASGPLGSSHALLIVTADSPEEGLELLAQDPLLEAGVIESRTARVWNPVIGPWNN